MVSSISSEYHQSNQASWLGTSCVSLLVIFGIYLTRLRYLLATCTFTPLYGRLSNVMGRRGANQTAVFFAGIGTLCCGLSTSLEMLIAARFVSYHTSLLSRKLTVVVSYREPTLFRHLA